MMKTRTKVATGVAFAALLAGGGAYAWAGAGDDGEGNATGPAAEKARAAALAHVGGGTANEVERGDEEGAWEVEVTKGGKTVDVHLDADYGVLSVDSDSENESGDTDS
jgi:uncharacterized membrane protein YkoI